MSLSQEYQVGWLTKEIESFVVGNFDLKNVPVFVGALQLADQFDVPLLKMKLDEITFSNDHMVCNVLRSQMFKTISIGSKRNVLFKIIKSLLNESDQEEIILKSLQKVLF